MDNVRDIPPTPKLLDYPASIGLSIEVALTIILIIVVNKFDPTHGTLAISLLVVLSFLGIGVFSMFFSIPKDELIIGGLAAAFGAVVSYWISKQR